MTTRRLVSSPLFWSATAVSALAIGFGCSSSSSGGGSTNVDASTPADASPDTGGGGDGAHDGPSPDAQYGACAIKGSFGSPCHATTSGPDTTDCTDPSYPQCFVGGQGAWCTKACTQASDCTAGASDAGCVPIGCNSKGYCH